ncbi:hypothetical protein ASF53_21065 [Methylobacterium sp. Leaf123]|uniref:serine hydrolase domain-containing protein n=1 Tax=Methylobacterium sp. Leaf123 TaxID=1736264 RepID=UPI0006FD94C4|nr:serine hydrolase [Methylobacterium sp. Leaf123]KQQ26426.1 hypothetical protein ASF53_21065 [Methylobacterium sp. Leaf123]
MAPLSPSHSRTLAVAALVSVTLAGCSERPGLLQKLWVGTAYSAKTVCSGMFVAGRTAEAVAAQDLHPISWLTRLMRISADQRAKTATVTFLGLAEHTAAYRPGIGCALVLETDRRAATDIPAVTAVRADESAIDPAVQHAVEAAWGSRTDDTRAIVVMHRGRIVAERYAPEFSADTPFLGWSMSKSVTAAVAGLALADGRVSLDEPVAAPEWPQGDPRRGITVRHLLQMTSGLSFGETYTAGNDSTRMLFAADDMAGFAAGKPLVASPGERWSYSSGSTNILARFLTDRLGGSQAAQRYMHERLFAPAGMTRATFEEDTSGTPVGSSYIYATARDWAQFGQLFLARGRVGSSEVLPTAWIDFVCAPVGAADASGNYGGSFWLNGRDSDGVGRRFPHLPADAYFAQGHNGQVVGIFPSHEAVIVRLGWTPEGLKFGIDASMAAILAALPQDGRKPD